MEIEGREGWKERGKAKDGRKVRDKRNVVLLLEAGTCNFEYRIRQIAQILLENEEEDLPHNPEPKNSKYLI